MKIACFLGLGQNIATLLVGRIVGGLIVGVTTVVVPTYIGEIASDNARGLLGLYMLIEFYLNKILLRFRYGNF